ncbi:MAG TPA: cytochrome c biogenesis protein CcdA, partial [Candidatus Deferrimicrobiaceae bacterium]
MLDYWVATLRHASSQPIGLLIALVLGTVSAAASSCCMLPAMGILVGYSGAREEKSRRTAVISTLCFMAGTVLSLMIIGGLAGLFGQVAQSSLGGYWKPFAGIVAIFFGLATLKLLPFDLSPSFL